MLREGWIILPTGGYCYGVEAIPKDHRHVELHGGFATREQAVRLTQTLREEFTDYDTIEVVKIETPAA